MFSYPRSAQEVLAALEAADGQRFLVNEFSGTPDRSPVVRNWTSLVR